LETGEQFKFNTDQKIMSTSTTTTTTKTRHINVNMVEPNPVNRKTFHDNELRALADSMDELGQLDDVHVIALEGGKFRLVIGERRWRAAKLLGWPTIRAQVMDMDDEEAMFIVLGHQLTTVDWPASEKGSAILAMYDLRDEGKRIYTLREIADRLHVTAASVMHWAACARCPVELRMAIDAGEVSMKTAALVMQLGDEDQQRQAAAMILRPTGKLTPMSLAEAAVLIETHFCRSLRSVSFDKKNDTLVKRQKDANGSEYGGACATCAACSATREGWEGGPGSVMTCFRVACFNEKVKASAEQVKAQALARGATLLTASEVREVFDRKTGEIIEVSGYRDMDAKADPALEGHCDESKMKTWRVLLEDEGGRMKDEVKKPKVAIYFAINPISGAGVELVKWEEAFAAVKGVKTGAVETEVRDQRSEVSGPVVVEDVTDPTWDESAERKNKSEMARDAKVERKRLMELMGGLHDGLVKALESGDEMAVQWLVMNTLPSLLRGDVEKLMCESYDSLEAVDAVLLAERAAQCFSAHEQLAVLLCSAVAGACVQSGARWEPWERWEAIRGKDEGGRMKDEEMSLEELRAELERAKEKFNAVSRTANARRMQLTRLIKKMEGKGDE